MGSADRAASCAGCNTAKGPRSGGHAQAEGFFLDKKGTTHLLRALQDEDFQAPELVTGAASGLGRTFAHELAKSGMTAQAKSYAKGALEALGARGAGEVV